MNSEWFILKKHEHLGPFSEGELISMFDKNKLEEKANVWREGWQEAKSFEEAFIRGAKDDYSDSDIPPPLPGLDQPDKVHEKQRVLTKAVQKKRAVSKKKKKRRKKKASLNFGLIQKYRVGLLGSLVGVIALFSISLHYVSRPDYFARPTQMKMTDFKRLTNTAKRTGELKVSGSLSTDKKTLWLSLNTPINGKVYISLKSDAEKILGEKAEFEAQGVIQDKLISLDKFKFKTGTRITDGFYDLEVTSLDDIELPWWNRFTGEQPTPIEYRGRVLITSLRMKSFKKQMTKVLRKKRANSKIFWEELIQKYQTVMMISRQIQDGFSEIFSADQANWKSRTKFFENKYKGQYGVFFTEFVKANEASYKKLYKKKFSKVNEVLASYNHLSKLATEIGEHSMYILELLQNFDGSDEMAELIKVKGMGKLTSIIERCQTKLRLLTKTL